MLGGENRGFFTPAESYRPITPLSWAVLELPRGLFAPAESYRPITPLSWAVLELPRGLFAPAEQYIYRKTCRKRPHSSGVLCLKLVQTMLLSWGSPGVAEGSLYSSGVDLSRLCREAVLKLPRGLFAPAESYRPITPLSWAVLELPRGLFAPAESYRPITPLSWAVLELPRGLFAPAEQYIYRKTCRKRPHSSGVLCLKLVQIMLLS